MEEELSLTDIALTIGLKYERNGYKNVPNHFTQRFFATVDKEISEFTIQKEEVEAIKRISKEELRKDVEANPQKYTPNMKKYVEIFH